jgi:two-component system LytT family response regulator
MKNLQAIIVDDEESARDVLENLLLRFCPNVAIIGKFSNLPDAVENINSMKPDLVFLDIEMPKYAGFEIVNFFKTISFEIIFVTAYDKYAIRAFEISASDYLLKPIDIDRLKHAVEKVQHRIDLQETAQRMKLLSETLASKEIKNIAVVDKGYQHIIPIETIIAIEACESYSIVHTLHRKYTASKNLKHFEQMFEEAPGFIRIHKSWLIHMKYLLNYSRSELSVNLQSGIVAKLSKYKKAEFEEELFG